MVGMLHRGRHHTRMPLVVAYVVAALLGGPQIAWAQSPEALAQQLFEQGHRDMAAGRLAAACEAFAQSQRLDPATGTLLNLATCHEKQGRLAQAWAEFTDAKRQAERQGRADRVTLADARLRALVPQLGQVRIIVPTDAAYEVTLDSIHFTLSSPDTTYPLDPGPHQLRIANAGMQDWTTEFTVSAGQTHKVNVPALTPLVREPDPPDLRVPVPVEPVALPRARAATAPSSRRFGTGPAVAYGVAGVGALVGVAAGIRALSTKAHADAHCTGGLCDPDGWRAQQKFQTAAWVANAGFAVAVVGGVVGTLLWRSAPRVAVVPSGSGAVAQWEGNF